MVEYINKGLFSIVVLVDCKIVITKFELVEIDLTRRIFNIIVFGDCKLVTYLLVIFKS